MDSELVPARTFAFRPQAERAQQILEASGVASTISGDDASGWAPHIGLAAGGVTLFVDQANLDEAKELLAEIGE